MSHPAVWSRVHKIQGPQVQGPQGPFSVITVKLETLNHTIVLSLLGATTQLLFLRKMGGAAGAVQYISSLAQIGTDKRES